MNETNIYLEDKNIYNYDKLLLGENIKKEEIGINKNYIINNKYININTNDITLNDENIDNLKNYNIIKCNKYIKNIINNFFNEFDLKQLSYENRGLLIDYDKSNEIKLYNDYLRRKNFHKENKLNQKNISNKLEISIFEVFNL